MKYSRRNRSKIYRYNRSKNVGGKRSTKNRGKNRGNSAKQEITTITGLQKMNCNPRVKGRTVSTDTCFTEDALSKIKTAYNKNHRKNAITATDPKEIWTELRQRLTTCSKEDCWLEQIKETHVRRQLDEILFAPDHPKEWMKKPNAWLSNFDIAAVLRQYEESHPHFKLLGPSSIDYDSKPSELGGQCVWPDLCRLSMRELLNRGKTQWGISFNLDEYSEPGSHWVSMFVDVPNKIIYYYDSALNPMPKEVKRLQKEIIKQGKNLDQPVEFKCYKNRHTHQRTTSECGMYSLFFIITFLTGETEEQKNMEIQHKIDLFSNKNIPDAAVRKYRTMYFNQPV